MYKIVCKKELNSAVTYMEIEAPFVARKAKAGQFIIFRVDDKSERVPLTIAGYDREKGTVAIIFQKVGLSTELLGSMNEGDYIQDFVGPLGKPTDVEDKKRVCVVGGGVGCAIAYPSAKAFKEAGVETDVIVGFRNAAPTDPPRLKIPDVASGAVPVGGAACIGIIGGADGPTSIFVSGGAPSDRRVAYSSLYFTPPEQVTWQLRFSVVPRGEISEKLR